MKGIISKLCVAVVLSAAAAAQGATYSRIDVDLSALPAEKSFFRNVILSRVWARTPPTDAAATLKLRLIPDGSLDGEKATVKVSGGVAEVRGGRFRSLIFGTGVLLRSMRYGAGAYSLEDGEYSFDPAAAIRVAYFARHFDNWYLRSSADELLEYIEDLALWGINGICAQLDYPEVDAAKASPADRAVFAAASAAIAGRVAALDMDLVTFGGNNCAPSNMPEEFRAVKDPKGSRGADQFNVCPEKPGALEYLESIRRDYIKAIEGLPVSGFLYWPFDEGGCACEKCAPWGGTGYVKLMERFCGMNKAASPGSKHIVSTWLFRKDDWETFYPYLEKSGGWIDAIMVDGSGDFPRYPLEHPVPRGIPVVTFPEISMWGRFPWGGTGATPLSGRFDRLYRQCQSIAKGFYLYSEGIYEDANKVAINGIYIDPKRKATDVLADYAQWELPGADAGDFVSLCEKLEAIYETRKKTGSKKGWRGEVVANYLREEEPAVLERRLAVAREAAALADRIDASIIPSMRMAWRWRQIWLRAKIDEAIYAARDVRTPAAIPYYAELVNIYHARRQATELMDGVWRGYTCPPFAEHPDARAAAVPVETTAVSKMDNRTKNKKRDPGLFGDYWWANRFLSRSLEIEKVRGKTVDIAMLGDSITHFWECKHPESWAKFASGRTVLNLGFGGDRTENVIWRIEHGELDGYTAKNVTLMIGTNNNTSGDTDPANVAAGVEKIVGMIRERQPGARIILHAILPRGASEKSSHAAPRRRNEATNALLAEFAERDGNIVWLDIGEKFLDATGWVPESLMKDQIHPTDAGYEIWSAALDPLLSR